jgi:ech hydrogenase subunit D
MDGPNLLARAEAYRDGGWRLAGINATSVLPTEELEHGAYDIAWSFARGADLEHVQERVLPGEEVPSISPFFGGAFLFENELRELFGIDVTGIDIDLQGQLYKTAERVPFSPSAIRARIEKVRPAAPPKPERPATPAAPGVPSETPAAQAQPAGKPETPAAQAQPAGKPEAPAAAAQPRKETTTPEARP